MSARRLRAALALGVALCFFAAVPLAAQAAAGDLDLTFGGDGKVTTDITGNTNGYSQDNLFATAAQSDGKIVAAGQCPTSDGVPLGTPYRFCLARYTNDGSLDATFGGDGIVITHILQNSTSHVDNGNGTSTNTPNTVSSATAVAVQSNGKIVVAGQCWISGGGEDFCVARYNSDGSLDSSFGPGCTTHSSAPAILGCSALFDVPGIVVTDVAGGSPAAANVTDLATGIAVQPDGHIVVVGFCQVGVTFQFCLARYNSDGSLAGTAITPIGGILDTAQAVAVQADGKIVAAGRCYTDTQQPFCLARYNSNGSLDTSFGADGKTFASPWVDGGNIALSVAIQSDGRIVAAGFCGAGVACFARFNANGSLDTSFGSEGTGTVLYGALYSYAYGVAIQGDGKIVAGGNCNQFDFCAFRYNSDGSLDATFGGGGTAATSMDAVNQATAMAIQGDGKIVVAGYCVGAIEHTTDFCLARFDGDAATANQAPVAVGNTYAANQGNQLSVPVASGVLANDSDPDAGTTLSAVLESGPAHGTLTLASNGSFLYTPVAVYSGSDTFTYRASDGSLTSNLATVTINVTSLSSIINSQPKLTTGQKASLNDKLAAAATFFSQGKLNSACGKLSEFITQVNGLTPSKLSASTATVLIDGANARKTYYGCPA